MTLALKSRCENVLKRRTSRAERQNARGRGRKRPVGPRDAGRPRRENAGTVGPGHTGRPRRESAGTVGPGHTGRPRRENAGTVGPGRTGRPRRESAGTVGPGRTGRPRRESAGTVGPGRTGRPWRENAGTVGPGRTGRPRRESAGTVGPGHTGRPRRESAGTVGPGHTGRSWRENAGTVGPGRTGRPRRESAGTVGPGRTGRPRRESAGTVAERARREDRLVGLCEIHFVPLVVGQRDENKEQRLHCVEQKGFAPCPRPLAMGGPHPASAHCELNKNTQRCHRQQLSSRQSCRVYQTCDHGLLLSGGWKEHLTNQQHVNNLVRFQRMLRTNGFRSENIKTFFAGDGQLPVGEENEGVYPATEKVMIRSHLSYICRATNCADSLVLYLNSPTRNDGTMLLWDVNNNGIADQKEKYSVGELLTDLEGCKANRVFIFIDQSYPGTLVKRLRSSNKHPNVAIIGNSQGSDFTWAPSFTELWAGLQPNQCISDYILKNFAWAASSSVGVVEATPGLVNSTIYGGPCRNNPPLTPEEMKREFMGCQNLPTAVWYQTVQRKDPTP
ncbi:uncharacterized protein LOC144596166 [Rhinoraja longicauda]